MAYYYPLTTRDFTFENIFSSESISPPNYYARRGFGFDYFDFLEGINFDDAIILYEKLPAYNSKGDIKFVLEISDSAIDSNDLQLISNGVYAYRNTIYFNRRNLRVLFFSDKELKITVLKANVSLPTKCIQKYSNFFSVVDEKEAISYPELDSLKIPQDPQTALKIGLDKRFNHFKGFVYGLLIGMAIDGRKKETRLKVLVQEVTNSFAELKSRLEDKNSFRNTIGSLRGIHYYVDKVFQAIDTAEEEYHSIVLNDDVDEEKFLRYLLDNQSRIRTLEEIRKYIDYLVATDELLGRDDYQSLVDRFFLDQHGLSEIFEELKLNVQQYINEVQSDQRMRQRLDELNSSIKSQIQGLVKSYQDTFSSKKLETPIDLNGISYDFLVNEVLLNIAQDYLTTKSDNEFTMITNVILKFARSERGPARREIILRIVEQIGNSYNSRGKDTLLYQYLDNRIDFYSLEKATNIVMKNFVAFAFNPDSLEKLDEFLVSKNVEARWMSFAFWGAYNGFANIGSNFAKGLFEPVNCDIQDEIDNYLAEYIAMMQHERLGVLKENSMSIVHENKTVKDPEKSYKDFYESSVQGKYKLTLDQFSELCNLKKLNDFQGKAKTRFKINKKDSVRLFSDLKHYFDSNNLFN